MTRMRQIRKLAPVVAALAVALGMTFGGKVSVANAACYWSSYSTDTRTNTSLRGVTITSSVRSRTGFTCSGLVNELNVYSFSLTIKIVSNDEWYGYTRYLRSVRLVDGTDHVLKNYLNVRSCAAANCTMTYSGTPNLTFYASGDAYTYANLYAYCEDCSITSLGGWEFGHYYINGTTGAFYCTC